MAPTRCPRLLWARPRAANGACFCSACLPSARSSPCASSVTSTCPGISLSGRAVVALRAIPKLDPLAYTAQRVSFIEPLSEVPLYALWHSGGALALQIVGGLIAAGIGYVLFRPLWNKGPFVYFAIALALAAINSWLVVRPATLSFLLIALILGLIELHRQAPSEKVRRRVLWCWPPLLLFWASAHGFAFIGAGLCVTYAAYRGCCWAARGRIGALLPEADGRDAGPTALAAGWLRFRHC